MARYTVVYGDFPCHTCKEVVKSLRQYIEEKELTWVCSQKHMSRVSLDVRKKKK
jgi:hypothetical protein